MSAANVGHDEGDVVARLRIAVARLSKRLKPTTAAGSLTTTEVDVLQTVARIGPVKLSELAGQAGLNPTMLSRVIAKLEDQGSLVRLGDATDGRICLVEVTEAGTGLSDRVRSERNDVLSKELELLPPADREALLGALPALEALAERLVERSASVAPGPTSR